MLSLPGRVDRHVIAPLDHAPIAVMKKSMCQVFLCFLIALASSGTTRAQNVGRVETLFAKTNLVAWCIVPFDAKKRTPEQRAQMMERLGFKNFTYDYRVEHIPTFDTEMDSLKKHGIQLTAWWFPTVLNDEGRGILELLGRRKIQTQLWVTGGGKPTTSAGEQDERVAAEAERVGRIAEAASQIGSRVALYNHGGWFGEPTNQIAIIEHLRKSGTTNIGIVYNLHHGHDQMDQFPDLLRQMKPYLWVLNLNGMVKNGDRENKKILPIGQGNLESKLIGQILESGWFGQIGILNHTDEDAEARLLDNLDGLNWVVSGLENKSPKPRPVPRSWTDKKVY